MKTDNESVWLARQMEELFARIEQAINALEDPTLRDALFIMASGRTYGQTAEKLGVEKEEARRRVRVARERIARTVWQDKNLRDAAGTEAIAFIDAAAERMVRLRASESGQTSSWTRRWVQWVRRVFAVRQTPDHVADIAVAYMVGRTSRRPLMCSYIARPVVLAAAAVAVAGSVGMWQWQRYEVDRSELYGVDLNERRILQNVPPALVFRFGMMYADGDGVPQDVAAATRWYRVAAEQNYAPAQIEVARMYAEGRGVAQNDVLAFMWMQIAGIEQEQADSLMLVARMSDAAVDQAERYAKQWLDEFMRQDHPEILGAGPMITVVDSTLPGAGSPSDNRRLREDIEPLQRVLEERLEELRRSEPAPLTSSDTR